MGGHYDPVSMPTEFGSYLYLMNRDGKIDRKRYEEIEKFLFSKRKRRSTAEWEKYREIVRPTALYTYKNIALLQILGEPFLDVDFTSTIYDRIYDETLASLVPGRADIKHQVEVATNLFKHAKYRGCDLKQLSRSCA